jgi:hypothetical protein
MAPLWVAIGLCCGFVVLAAWSLGLFFVWSALWLLAAGIAHAVAIRAGWRVVVIPGWFALGASGLCAAFFAYGQIRAAFSGGQTIEAPIVVAGTWVFVSLIAVFSLGAVLQSRPRGSVH